MVKLLAWGLTGAGHFLAESFASMEKLVKQYQVKVTTFLSNAAVETVRIYGLSEKLSEISGGSYYSEILTESEENAASPHTGRFSKKAYDALIVSPATANTVAKIVNGIADTLITNAVAHACKGGVPVFIIPTDQESETETVFPPNVDREACRACELCPPIEQCTMKAVTRINGKARIDLSKCHGLGICARVCPFGVISIGERIKVRVRKLDLENTRRLRRIEGIEVLANPSEIIAKLSTRIGIENRKQVR